MTCETVAVETPANAATSLILTVLNRRSSSLDQCYRANSRYPAASLSKFDFKYCGVAHLAFNSPAIIPLATGVDPILIGVHLEAAGGQEGEIDFKLARRRLNSDTDHQDERFESDDR